MNWEAVDKTNEALQQIKIPKELPQSHTTMKKLIPDNSPDIVKNIIEPIMREKGDTIPVSQMPFDGVMPSGTAKLEKRGVAPFVPRWNPEKCIQCNQCSMVCPHAAIRPKLIAPENLKDAPGTFTTLNAMGKDKDKYQFKIQVYIEDCQGCSVCVNECPTKALDMKPIEEERERGENANEKFFESLPEDVLGSNKEASVKGSQFKQPLMEFSGACAGCGETPYIKLTTQLFGDRMIIANATGCSSIYGGTFPTIPYCKNKDGHGPAWANSLFEDNAEYGLGMRLAVDSNRALLKSNVEKLIAKNISNKLKTVLLYAINNWQNTDELAKENAKKIRMVLQNENMTNDEVFNKVVELQNYFIEKSVWSFGGDGWAYDIGYGGVDHVLASGKNINILVVDTEVYSNTGGQASKATPIGAVAKFAESGKTLNKKDLGMMMMSYGYVYVASIAMGANKAQAIKALKEAEEYDGPSIVISYAPCINHGLDMSQTMIEEKLAVDSGYWLLYRHNPMAALEGKNPFTLDSREPKADVIKLLDNEKRFTSLKPTFPEKVEGYREGLKKFIAERYKKYKKMAE